MFPGGGGFSLIEAHATSYTEVVKGFGHGRRPALIMVVVMVVVLLLLW